MICLWLANDHEAISCAGESHPSTSVPPDTHTQANFVPPWGLADMTLAGPSAREALAGRRHIDMTQAVALMPNVTQG